MAVQSSDAPPTHDVSAAAPTGEHGDAYAAGTEAEHASGGGLPQFEFQWWAGQIFWLLIIFAVLYVLLSKVFLPRLRRVKDERAGTIATAIEAARQVQAEAAGQAEVAKAEVEQARASRAGAQAQLEAARAAALSSEAIYRQLTGTTPSNLNSASAISKGVPGSLDQALAVAFRDHPAILASQYAVDASVYGVKSAEGSFLPQVNLSATVQRSYSSRAASGGSYTGNSATVGAQLRVPIYQGGQASATVRQKKEELGQARIDVDVIRDQVRAAVTSAWTQLQASRSAVKANRETLRASRLALDGVVQERDVGQRTTLDVLNGQANVLDAQIAVAQAERDVVVSSYALLSAIGRLTARDLGLQVALHDPKEHYNAVKDKWFGLRTPDGR